uniref:CGG triplet repeat-binding protein 1 n=1 Tax=Bactrocera latifrons TaxID=174628 RepID=A0A0K8WG17_BACLA
MASQYEGILRTDKSVLFCIYCNCSITGGKTFNVKQHFETHKHKLCVERRSEKTESQLLLNKYNTFSKDFCKIFLSANIPLEKARHPSVIEFLGKHTNKTVPSVTNLRLKYVPALY